MSHSNFLRELKALFSFLQSFWGALSGLSLFFPLSNDLFQVIPLAEMTEQNWGEGGALLFLSPEVITGVTTLIIFFILLKTISRRHDITTISRTRIQQQASKSFVIAIAALIFYLLIVYLVSPWIDSKAFLQNNYFLRRLTKILNDIFLLFFYSSFFALTTKAFSFLGMREFYRSEN